MEVNDIQEKTEKTTLKLEGTMKLLRNISSKSVIGEGGSAFGKVYNRANNKILIKKQQFNGKILNIVQKK